MGNSINYSGGSGKPSVITTEIPGAPPLMDLGHTGFDPSFFIEMANRRQRQSSGPAMRRPQVVQKAVTKTPFMGKPEDTGEPEIWVDGITGQPSQPWFPNAVRVGVNRRLGKGTPGGSSSIQDPGAGKPDMTAGDNLRADAAYDKSQLAQADAAADADRIRRMQYESQEAARLAASLAARQQQELGG